MMVASRSMSWSVRTSVALRVRPSRVWTGVLTKKTWSPLASVLSQKPSGVGWPTTSPRMRTIRPMSSVPSGSSVSSSTGALGASAGAGVGAGTAATGCSATSRPATSSSPVSTISAIAQIRSARTRRPMIHGQIEGPLRSTLISAIQPTSFHVQSVPTGFRRSGHAVRVAKCVHGRSVREWRHSEAPPPRPRRCAGWSRSAAGRFGTSSVSVGAADPDAALGEFVDVDVGRDALVGRRDAEPLDPAGRLELAGDRERVAGRPLHRADPVGLVVEVEEFVADLLRLAVLEPLGLDTECDEVAALGALELRLDDGDEEPPRRDLLAVDLDRIEAEEPEVADDAHRLGVPRVAERLVLHVADLALVGPGHDREPAGGVERFEPADRFRELRRLDLRQRIDLQGLAVAQDPGAGRVVVEHALERVDDLVVQRRDGLLRQAADLDPNVLGLVEL